jgi:esterase/lipase superfamily enzyme
MAINYRLYDAMSSTINDNNFIHLHPYDGGYMKKLNGKYSFYNRKVFSHYEIIDDSNNYRKESFNKSVSIYNDIYDSDFELDDLFQNEPVDYLLGIPDDWVFIQYRDVPHSLLNDDEVIRDEFTTINTNENMSHGIVVCKPLTGRLCGLPEDVI